MTAEAHWPLLAYTLATLALAVAILGLSYVLGQRHRERATAQPYESGIIPTGTARARISVAYYLVAAFFVIFDLEVVFLFAWAVAAPQVGWAGYAGAMVFLALLLAGLLYLWRIGALTWHRAPEG